MENHLADQTKILSMNIRCCEGCPKILKKKLLKMPGVGSVAIDTENNLVFVTGTVNATTLLNYVAQLGKRVYLLPNDKNPKGYVDEKHFRKNERRDTNNNNNNNFTARAKRTMYKNCCCQDGRHNYNKKEVEKEEEEEHKCEAYVPPKIDPRTCRDYFCKIHPSSRKIVDRVPAENSSLFGIGGMPFFGGFAPPPPLPYGGGSYLYPAWHREEPPPFGYGPQRRMLPQHPFGLH